MNDRLGSSCAIVGVGRSITRRGEPRLKTPLQLGAEAAAEAMRQADIGRDQIGALFTGRTPAAYMTMQYNQSLLNELKIGPTFNTEITSHGGGAVGALHYAMMAVHSQTVDYALCVTNEASNVWMDLFGASAAWESDLQFEAPYGSTSPSIYAQSACRYMHEYSIEPEMMAKVAVENRRWALHRPDAAMFHKGPITIQDVLSSKMIASPLRMLDCAAWFQGGIGTAMIVTRAELARSRHQEATWIAGVGQCSTHEWVGERMSCWGYDPVRDGPSLVRTGAAVAARQAYKMSGLRPQDIDVVQTSAPFTFANLIVLEELGFCGEGEGGAFALSGGIDYDGGLAFNTLGGYLSFGQVGQGLYNLDETIDQLWGRARGRQVNNAKIGLVHGHGGPNACHAVIIIAREQTH